MIVWPSTVIAGEAAEELRQAYAEWFGVPVAAKTVDLSVSHWRRCTADRDVLWRYPEDKKCWFDGCDGTRT